MKRLARRVALEGGRVVVGGHSTVPFAARGEAPWREMELLVESGFTPLEVIQAATGTAAAFLYRDVDLGTLQPGRLADLVVLSGNPLRHIAEIRTVERVMAGGVWVDVARYRQY
jgi:imidazolonepropionase-like amidohydrolase